MYSYACLLHRYNWLRYSSSPIENLQENVILILCCISIQVSEKKEMKNSQSHESAYYSCFPQNKSVSFVYNCYLYYKTEKIRKFV